MNFTKRKAGTIFTLSILAGCSPSPAELPAAEQTTANLVVPITQKVNEGQSSARFPQNRYPSCLAAIEADNSAKSNRGRDWDAWWPEGVYIRDTNGHPPKEHISWRDVPVSGFGVFYHVQVLKPKVKLEENRAVARVREKVRIFYDEAVPETGGQEFSGRTIVLDVEYGCERRNGEWAILTSEDLSRREYGSDDAWQKRRKAWRASIESEKK